MKVRVARAEIAGAVGWAAKRIGSRASFPVLAGVLLQAEGTTLTVRAGEGNVGEGETSVECEEVAEPGTALVSGKLLAQIMSKLPNQPVLLELDEDKAVLHVTCGRSSFNLRVMPVADYPAALLAGDEAVRFTLPAGAFTRTVGQVAPAASKEESRPVLTAVSLEVSDGQVSAAATDSYRLAAKQFPFEGGGEEILALVPAVVLTDIAKTLEETEASEVEVALEERLVQFTAAGHRISTALTEGTFPNWRGLMPADDDYTSLLEVEREPLLEALDRISVVANTAANVPLHVEVSDDGEVVLSVNSRETGTGNESVQGKLVEGSGFAAAYNPAFLTQALKSTGAERVSVAFREPLKPALLRPVAEEDETPEELRIILMPMRVKD